MNTQQPTFEQSVADAADCYVHDLGSIEAAIDALQQRRDKREDAGRCEEAIAYLRYKEGSE
jgi:hypothetical protein